MSLVLFILLLPTVSLAQFSVRSDDAGFSSRVAVEAERLRRAIALEWTGSELEPWDDPCRITVLITESSGGGRTTFIFTGGGISEIDMLVQGDKSSILSDVLPHEITHVVLASHFGKAIPRWADEGAATTMETSQAQAVYERELIRSLTTGRGIAFNKMFAMTEYPHDYAALYAQGASLSRFLIERGGKRHFVNYLDTGMNSSWTNAVRRHYGMNDLSELQETWLRWVRNRPATNADT